MPPKAFDLDLSLMPVTTGGDTHRSAGQSGPHSRSRQFSVPNRSDSGAGRLDGYSERRPRAAIREHLVY